MQFQSVILSAWAPPGTLPRVYSEDTAFPQFFREIVRRGVGNQNALQTPTGGGGTLGTPIFHKLGLIVLVGVLTLPAVARTREELEREIARLGTEITELINRQGQETGNFDADLDARIARLQAEQTSLTRELRDGPPPSPESPSPVDGLIPNGPPVTAGPSNPDGAPPGQTPPNNPPGTPPGETTPPGNTPPGSPPGFAGNRVVNPNSARDEALIAKAVAEQAPAQAKAHSTGKEAGREIADIAPVKAEAKADVVMPSRIAAQMPVKTENEFIAEKLPLWEKMLSGTEAERLQALGDMARVTAGNPELSQLVAETQQRVSARPLEGETPQRSWAPVVSTAKLDELGDLIASKGGEAKADVIAVVGRMVKPTEVGAGEGNAQKGPLVAEGIGMKGAGVMGMGTKFTPVGNQPSRTLAALLARLRASNPPARGIASVPPSKQAAVPKVSGEPSPTVLARVKPLLLKKFLGKMAGLSGPELASPTAMGRIALFNLGWFFLLSFLVLRVLRRIKARLSRRLPRPVVSAKPVTLASPAPALPAEPAKVTPPVQKHKGRPRERRRSLPNHDPHTIPASEGAQNPMDTALTVPKYSERRKEKIRAAARLVKPRLESRAAKPLTIAEEKPEEKVAVASEKTRVIA